MIQRINKYDFVRAFDSMGRSENFSVLGREALFDYLESLETEDHQIDFDAIAICCDYQEFENLEEYNDDYGTEYEDIDEIDEVVACDYNDEGSFICYAH